jgi:hypothetical protein
MSEEARFCLGCKQKVVEGRVKHSPGCKVAVELREQREAEETLAAILSDKGKYQEFLTESIAKHLIRLHQLAMRGSHRSAQQFREGALDILELLNAEGEKRDSQAAGVLGQQSLDQPGGTRRRAAGTVRGLDGTPVAVAPGEGRGRAAGDSDEGRTRSGEPDQAVPE